MITPLQKHRGQNGVIAALFVLAAASAVVVITHRDPRPPPADPPRPVIAPAAAAVPPAEPARTVTPPARSGPITATGVVGFDEHHTAHVMAPAYGWVEKLAVKRAGRRVRAGEVLATLYSVDIYRAELDLVAQVQQFTTQALLSDARRRLQRYGMPPPLIARVEQTGVARGRLPLIASRAGTLVAHHALPGLYVEPMELFTITDPSRVWVFADFPEADVARMQVGTPAKLAVAGVAKPIAARVAYIYRVVDAGMRKVRFEIQTARPIKPGTTVDVTITPGFGLAPSLLR